jgi:hypothetical protein
LVALEQNVKSTFTKAEKDGSLSGVIELKQAVKGVDVTGKIDTKSQLNFVLEHGAALPPPPLPTPSSKQGDAWHAAEEARRWVGRCSRLWVESGGWLAVAQPALDLV